MKKLTNFITPITLVTIVFLTFGCKEIVKKESSIDQNKVEENVKIGISTNEPFAETIYCKFYCNQGSVEMKIDQGYIVTEASFNANENISFEGESLSFAPKKGTKNILFIHFQPDFLKIESKSENCPSSNLVIFLELDSLQNPKKREISKNIRFALYTGSSFYMFETKGETKGKIQITEMGGGIIGIKLNLEFGLTEENITGFELDSKLTIINQEALK